MLDDVVSESDAADIVDSPDYRLHIMTVLCRHLTGSEIRPVLGTGLIAAMTANAVHRRTLGWFFKRALFFDSRDLPPFYDATGFPLERIRLTAANLHRARFQW